MYRIEILFDDNISTKQTLDEKDFKNTIKWFSKRKVVSFNDVMVVDFSKVKLIRVLEKSE